MKRTIVFLLATLAFASCARIDAGYEGILINQYGNDKGVNEIHLVTGKVNYNPFTQDVVEFPVFVQTKDYDPFTVNARDGSVFTVDPTISFKIITGSSPAIYQKYRKDIEEITETTLYNYVRDAFRIQFNKYSTEEVTSRREEFESNVQNYLTNELDKEGFHLEMLTSGLQYPAVIVQAIDKKNEAVQKAMEIENQVKAAEASAKILVVNSEANAKALLVGARAEAESNRLKQQTLTDKLIQQQFIEKWNGELPTYGTVPQIFRDITKN